MESSHHFFTHVTKQIHGSFRSMASFLSAISKFLRRLFGADRSGLSRSFQPQSSQRTNNTTVTDRPPPVRDGSAVSKTTAAAVSDFVVLELRQLVYQATCDMPKARMHAGQFGSRLRKIDPSFSYEKYNFTKLIYLLEAVPDIVSLERVNNPGAAPAYYIRSVLDVKSLLRRVMEGFDSEDGWVHVGSVVSAMAAEVPGFSVHTYGFSQPHSFLESRVDLVEFNPDNSDYVRLRQPVSTAPGVTTEQPKRISRPRRVLPGPTVKVMTTRRVSSQTSANPVDGQSPHRNGFVSSGVANLSPASSSSINSRPPNSRTANSRIVNPRTGRPRTIVHLSKFAGFTPQVLNQKVSELAAIALSERWYFGPQPPDYLAYPILKSYLRYTFIRLQHERKVITSTNPQYRAFNTGLLDKLLRPIYALLISSPSSQQAWDLAFCISGEGPTGKTLVANFTDLPTAANYLSNPSRVFYHLGAGPPEVDWHHVIKDNMERLPPAFLAQYSPTNFTYRNTQLLSSSEFHAYKKSFATALDNDPVAYRNLVNRLEEALSRTLLKTQINYKTAVPTYYPNINSIDLLLPICLVEEDVADCAIVARQAESGKYIGHTILTLRQAYNNARLICKLDEHWLTRSMALSQQDFEEEEDDSEEFEADEEDLSAIAP